MTTPFGRPKPPTRIGLVLGAGGATGGAFHAGVLAALADELGWDARRAEIVVGTSAGSMAGAALRAGLHAHDLLARNTGERLSREGARLVASMPSPPASFGRPTPLARRIRPTTAKPATIARMALAGARPMAMLATLIPPGDIPIAEMAAAFDPLFGARWPQETLWVCAVRQRDGRRVVFGRDDDTSVALAVAASCAIPGFFAPVDIDGDTYVDGGVHSPTNLDLVAGQGLDLVIVSSPMSMAGRGVWPRADYALRRACRAFLDREAITVRRRGTPVVAFQPTGDDAAVMGINAMDPSRRAAVARQVRASTRRRLQRADVRLRLGELQ